MRNLQKVFTRETADVITSLPSGAEILVYDPADIRQLKTITVPNLLADAAFSITVANKVVATEGNITDFAAASGSYTFEQGDLIELSTADIYWYNGGTKTLTASYDLLQLTATTWSSITSKPAWATSMDSDLQVNDLQAIPVLSADFSLRQLKAADDSNSLNWNTRILQDPIGVQSIDWELRQLKDNAGNLSVDFATMFKVNPNIQQVLGEYFYKSSTAGDEVNDIRFYDNAGAFIVEKCTVANAAKGAGTWVEVFNSSSAGVTFASAAEVLAKTVNNKAIAPSTIDGGVKRLKGLINQDGTTDPVVTILENYFNVSFTPSYESADVYTLNCASPVFTNNKTFCFISTVSGTVNSIKRVSDTQIEITAAGGDGSLTNVSFEIEVYP